MRRVFLSGLSSDIATSTQIFVNKDVICAFHRQRKIEIYHKTEKRSYTLDVECENDEKECICMLSVKNGLLLLNRCQKDTQVVDIELIEEERTEGYASMMIRECVMRLSDPPSNFAADRTSFVHGGRLYTLGFDRVAHSKPLDAEPDAPHTEQEIKTDVEIDFWNTHVLENTVFLYGNGKRVFRLNMLTMKLDNITSQIPELAQTNGFTMFENLLYATSNELIVGQLLTFDLNSFLPRKRKRSSSVELDVALNCPVCWKPFQDPKVFPTCGHSVCAHCEKRLTTNQDGHRCVICPVCRVPANLDLIQTLPTNWALKQQCAKLRENSSVRCDYCKKPLNESETFNCEACALEENDVEVLVCGTCVVKEHDDHFESVKVARFADDEYKKASINRNFSRLPYLELEARVKIVDEDMRDKAEDKMLAFLKTMRVDYAKMERRVDEIMRLPMTQNAVDRQTGTLCYPMERIHAKVEKFIRWEKEVYRVFRKLNKPDLAEPSPSPESTPPTSPPPPPDFFAEPILFELS